MHFHYEIWWEIKYSVSVARWRNDTAAVKS